MKYFKPEEFKMGNEVVYDKMNSEFLEKLDGLRYLCSIPLKLNSSFRSKEYNKSIGGATNSMHLLGRAVDIACNNSITRAIILKNALNMGLTCGVYKTWIHIDDRETQLVYHG